MKIGLVVDSAFFNVFPLRFLKGDAATAMRGPTSVVMTEETAKKYFEPVDPLGKTVRINTPTRLSHCEQSELKQGVSIG